MNIADLHEAPPSIGEPFSAETIRRIRLFLAAFMVLVIVALGALGGRSDVLEQDQAADQVTEQQDAAPRQVYDGRGKWGGYAR